MGTRVEFIRQRVKHWHSTHMGREWAQGTAPLYSSVNPYTSKKPWVARRKEKSRNKSRPSAAQRRRATHYNAVSQRNAPTGQPAESGATHSLLLVYGTPCLAEGGARRSWRGAESVWG